MRVLMLPPFAWRPQAGESVPEVHAGEPGFVSALAREGVELTIGNPSAWPFNPLARQHNFLASLDPWRGVGLLARQWRFDIVVSVFEGGAFVASLLRRARLLRVPVVLWDAGLTEGWAIRERIQNVLMPHVDGVMVLASSQSRYIARRWRPRYPIEVIGHSIDTAFFHPLDLPDDGSVLSVGNDGGRDYGTLIAAMAAIDQPLVVRTSRALPASLKERSNVRVIANPVSFQALRELYARARVVVVPLAESLNASGITSLFEAYAMGRPVVVTAIETLQDFLFDGETCLTVAPGDKDGMRAAIQRLLDDPALAARLGAAGRRFVEREASSAALARRMAAALALYTKAGRIAAGR